VVSFSSFLKEFFLRASFFPSYSIAREFYGILVWFLLSFLKEFFLRIFFFPLIYHSEKVLWAFCVVTMCATKAKKNEFFSTNHIHM
jgi:hypothetical protein